MGTVHFAFPDDADELVKALEVEGYDVRLHESAEGDGWVLDVEPFDDNVVAMVDVYGGWLPGELPER